MKPSRFGIIVLVVMGLALLARFSGANPSHVASAAAPTPAYSR